MEDLWPGEGVGGTGQVVLLDVQEAAVERLKGKRKPWSDPKRDHVYSQTGLCHSCVQMAKRPAEEDGMWLCIGAEMTS